MTSHSPTNYVIDGTLSAGAITLPWWAQFLNEWAMLFITLMTIVLLGYRIALAVREWHRG